MDERGRDHGTASQDAARRRRAVSSGIDPDRGGDGAAQKLALHDQGELMSSEPITFANVFREVSTEQGPGPRTIRAAFEAILAGSWTPAQVAGFVVALRMRGETSSMI